MTRALVESGALDALCEADARIPLVVQKLLHALWFAYLASPAFKEALGRSMARCYARTVESQRASGIRARSETLLEFSVQGTLCAWRCTVGSRVAVFTNPTVAVALVREEGILDTICGFITRVANLHAVQDPVTGKRMLDGDASDRGLERGAIMHATRDLGYFVINADVVSHAVQSPARFAPLLDVAAALHGCLWVRRKLGAHVQFERTGYRSVVALDTTLWDHLTTLGNSLSLPDRYPLATFQMLAAAVWERLQPTLEPLAVVSTPFIDSQRASSMCLSLHRLLAVILRSACVAHGFALADVAPFLCAHATAAPLLAPVCHALRFVSTVEAGQWRRNGDLVVAVSYFYTRHECVRFTLAHMLFLTRCFIAAHPSPAQLLHFLTLQFDTSDSHSAVGVEAALRWLLALCGDRTGFLLDDNVERARCDVLHVLAGCGGTATRSRLTEALPEAVADRGDFDDLVRSVADFNGKHFALRSDVLLNSVDPYYAAWTSDQRQAAEEAWMAAATKAAAGKQEPCLWAPRSVAPQDAFGAAALRDLLRAPALWDLLFRTLAKQWEGTPTPADAEVKRYHEKLVHRCLDTLYVCHNTHPEAVALWAAPSLVALLRKHQASQPSFLQRIIARLLEALERGGDAAPAPPAAALTDAERKAALRAQALERQRAIKAKMQQQRDNFAAKNQEALATVDSQVAAHVCVLCRDGRAPDEAENPLCRMVLAQTWSVMADTVSEQNARGEDSGHLKRAKHADDATPVPQVPDEAEADDAGPVDDKAPLEVLVQHCERRFKRHLECSPAAGPRVLVRACGHLLHLRCYQTHFASLARRPAQELKDLGLDVLRGEYLCPLCSCPSNSVVPLHADENNAAAPVAFPSGATMPLEQWADAVQRWLDAPPSSGRGDLGILVMRVGTLLWGSPPASMSDAHLYDCVITAALCHELTTDDARHHDAMLRPIWEATRALVLHWRDGDAVMAAHLWQQLRGARLLARCDPFFVYTRLLLALPAALRFPVPLWELVASYCDSSYAVNVFRERVVVACDALGLTLDAAQLTSPAGVSFASEVATLALYSQRRVLPFGRSLPRVLQDKAWFTAAVEWRCPSCGTSPFTLAMCLLCGTFVCANGDCCRQPDRAGECTAHGKRAHGGYSLWLEVKRSTILVLRPGGGAQWRSPYLDSWGEEDVGLSRGRPLTLREELVEELRRRYVCGALVDLTTNTGKRLLIASWEMF